MIKKPILIGACALSFLAAACANNGAEPTTDGQAAAATPVAPQEGAAPATAAEPATFLGATPLGNVLIGSDGRTLYGFTNDNEARSTCYGGCAEAWPPVLVGQDWQVGPGLDLGIFATTVRDDGQLQLVAGKWPLYYYVGDEAPGDITGQGSGDVWFAVDTRGTLVLDSSGAQSGDNTAAGESTAADDQSGQDADQDGNQNGSQGDSAGDSGYGVAADDDSAGSIIGLGDSDLGQVLTDTGGLTLYGFTEDVDGQPSCDGACAEVWPPLIVDSLPADLDPAVFSLATRNDGRQQLVAGKWPLYRFAGDAVAGDINGQGSGDVWFAVAADGSLIK